MSRLKITNIPEKRRSHLNRGGSLNSRKIHKVSRIRSHNCMQWRKIRRYPSVQNFN